MTLIQEADSKLVIVSPYYKIDKWKKLQNAIKFPINKNIKIEFYVREGESQSIAQIKNIDFEPIEIRRLHTKLYFNEEYAIVSSMNLLESSDMESLDIAYRTESKKEYNELIDYYERYIKNNSSKVKPNKKTKVKYNVRNGKWFAHVESIIMNAVEKRFYSKFDNDTLEINGPNMYFSHISQDFEKNTLNICGIISNKERIELSKSPSIIHEKKNLKTFYDSNGNYSLSQNSIWYHSDIALKSNSIKFLFKEDYDAVIDIISDFIIGLQNFKRDLYNNERPDCQQCV